jgi:hypothetical protein
MMRPGSIGFRGRCLRLVGVTLAVWLVSLYPAFRLFGVAGMEAASISAVACLVPGCVVFWLLEGLSPGDAQIRAVLAGTGLRVAFGLAAAVIMDELAGLAATNYVVWLAVFYLVSLAVETHLILPARTRVKAG